MLTAVYYKYDTCKKGLFLVMLLQQNSMFNSEHFQNIYHGSGFD